MDWTDQPYSDPGLSPRACSKPAGRFHRGATRGKLVVTVADGIDRYRGRWFLPDMLGESRVAPCVANIPIES